MPKPKRSKTARRSKDQQQPLALPPSPANTHPLAPASVGTPSTATTASHVLPPVASGSPEQAMHLWRPPADLQQHARQPHDQTLLLQVSNRIQQLERRVHELEESSRTKPQGIRPNAPTGAAGHVGEPNSDLEHTLANGAIDNASLAAMWDTFSAPGNDGSIWPTFDPNGGLWPVTNPDVGADAVGMAYAGLLCEHNNSLWNCDECYNDLREH
ncbi:hypothetical protein LTR85_009702 [Meristemomyces frigidus]|nr:hypothetical protein LTR85_009702 [Meristemomyces frigidus]